MYDLHEILTMSVNPKKNCINSFSDDCSVALNSVFQNGHLNNLKK